MLAPALSDGRRAGVQVVSGPGQAFATDLATVYVPAAPTVPAGMSPLRVLTAGIAVQGSPTKEWLRELDLAGLSPRQRRAVRIVEGCAAMARVLDRWPRLAADLRELAPGWEPEVVPDAEQLLARAAGLAAGDRRLDVPEVFGVPPAARPLSGHRERLVADGRRRNRVPWSSRRALRRMALAMPVGGVDGERAASARIDEAPDAEESSDRDRRIGIPYPEWDHRTRRYRADFVTVIERRRTPAPAGSARVDPRLRRWFAAPHATGWRSRQEDGDQLDVPAYVEGYAAARAGQPPDDRVYQGLRTRRRDVATAVLLDATSSLQAGGGARLRVQLACCEALCAAMAATGERFAVFAFTGETRHRVELTRLRDFTDPPWARPSGAEVRPSGYTRLGAALRHTTTRLLAQPAERRVLLSLGDGVPSDEGYEGRYAEADVHRALDEAVARGIGAHHLAVGRAPDERLRACFGDRWHRVARAGDLPGVLARVHRELTAP